MKAARVLLSDPSRDPSGKLDSKEVSLPVNALSADSTGMAPRAGVLLLLRLARLKSLRAGLEAHPSWSSLLQLVCKAIMSYLWVMLRHAH